MLTIGRQCACSDPTFSRHKATSLKRWGSEIRSLRRAASAVERHTKPVAPMGLVVVQLAALNDTPVTQLL